jgi:hypothetical protein
MTLSMEHPYFRLPKPFSIVELIFSFQYFQSGTYKIIGIKPGTLRASIGWCPRPKSLRASMTKTTGTAP